MTEPATFPQTLYVELRNTDGDPADAYFSASVNINDHAEINNKIKVGVYQLVELQEVEFQVVATKVVAP